MSAAAGARGLDAFAGLRGRRQVHLVGFMGSGKSTVGQLLARRLVWSFLDLDVLVERHAERSVAAIFAGDGEAEFRRLESFALRQAVTKPHTVLALGGGTGVDPENWKVCSRAAVTVWLRCPLELLLKRIPDAAERPLWLERCQLERLLSLREPGYRRCDHIVDAVEPAAAVAERIEAILRGELADNAPNQ